jgi:hypothetical protein
MKALLFVLSGLVLTSPALAQQSGQGGAMGETVGGTIGSTVGQPVGASPLGPTMGGAQGVPVSPYATGLPGSNVPAYGQAIRPPDGLPGIPYPADGLILTPARPGYENDP